MSRAAIDLLMWSDLLEVLQGEHARAFAIKQRWAVAQHLIGSTV